MATERLTKEQQEELAACFAEYCGVSPDDKQEWRGEMVSARKYVRSIMSIWRRREERKNTYGS